MKELHGIFPALLTPFHRDGSVNHPVLRQLVEMNVQKGVHGFYVCGSTGEALMLPPTQRKEILETVIDQAAGRCRIIAHVGCMDTLTAVDLARHAGKAGADAVSSVAPFYYGFSFDEIKSYYFDIVEEAALPMVVYNIPLYSKVNLSEDQLALFLNDERFIGLKHTSSDFFLLERLTRRFPEKVFFNGFDEMFLSALPAGATGGIGSTYNMMAEKFIRILKYFHLGRMDEARAEQQKANNIISALIRVGVMPGEKALLCKMGLDFGVCRRPFKALESNQADELWRVWLENQ